MYAKSTRSKAKRAMRMYHSKCIIPNKYLSHHSIHFYIFTPWFSVNLQYNIGQGTTIMSVSSNSFYIQIIWGGIGFMWKMTFEIFIKSLRFETPWVRKKGFYESVCLSVCLSVIGRILDNARQNYQIGLSLGTLYRSRKSKDKFVNQPHLTKIEKSRPFFFVFEKSKNSNIGFW